MERIIALEELEALKELPRHEPGREITVTLAQLPDYLAVNGLKAVSMQGDVLLVKASVDE